MAKLDLTKYGITGTTEIVHNPSYELLFEEETKPSLEGYEVGKVSELGAVDVMTGIYTGRSPKDKFIVMDENSKNTVWWTSDEYKNDNHPASEEAWAAVKEIAKKELSNKRLYVVDAFCGANKDTRMAVRFIMEVAWQAHFVTNMFIKPTAEELENFEPDFVVYNASKAKVENYKELGLNSETAVMFNITSKEQVIVNTWYGGEMKKGMFSMMNYFLPLKGIASMHCSANTDMEGKNTAIFFGLSGTGKTTLSTDPKRLLIGDDEHGWDDNGVFNFEGGCYAKVINLDKDSEPDIYNAIKRNALLENVTLDAEGHIDFADKSVTENTRVSYPINHIQNIVRPISSAPAAKNVIFLSADAFGVLPPVSILSPEQTQYYFLSGFTAKEAIVSTMGVLANVTGDTEDAVTVAQAVQTWFPTSLAALSFLIFNLLDSPCLAAIATMAQQMQSKKWFWFAILFQNIFAYIVCLCIYQIGSFVTGGSFGVGTVFGFVFAAIILFLLFRPDPYKDQKVYSKRSVQAAN